MIPRGTVFIPGPSGRLEAIYKPAERAPVGAIVCHPHPQHGGTMHNKVVYRAAKAFEVLGWAVLRFNFRGVGSSEGSFADGRGEANDVRAALTWLADRNPETALVVAGFSFGSVVGLPVGARDPRVSHLVGIGTPIDSFPFDLLADVPKPKLFIQGDKDEHGPLPELEAGLAGVAKPWELVVIEGADHFFEGRLPEMQRAIVEFFTKA
ncbi:MAG: alpha/beta hydrolase [Gemmatimonadota bacterium]